MTTASRNFGQRSLRSDASADIQKRLTQQDRDPSDSWFGCHRVGLKGRTSAPPRSPSSFPHSEQSASERLEGQRKQGQRLLRPAVERRLQILAFRRLKKGCMK